MIPTIEIPGGTLDALMFYVAVLGVLLLLGTYLRAKIVLLRKLFGVIIELGFCGGHGTAGGMMDVFADLGWSDGATLALMTATAGLFLGIFSGMALINYGVRKGYTSVVHATEELRSDEDDLVAAEKPSPGAMATTNKSIIESFAFHASLIGIAVLIGWFLQRVLSMWIRGMPLFPLAMIGGLIVQLVIVRTPWAVLIDRRTFQGIQGVALEFLIVAAIASIKAPVVLAYAAPLAIIVAVTMGLMVAYFFWAGKRMFQEHWFENAIVAYGSLTGMAAVGLMLLRTVDPEMKTNAGVAYALRGPFISPIVGGGILSASLPIIILSYGPLAAGVFFLGAFITVIVLCKAVGWWRKPA